LNQRVRKTNQVDPMNKRRISSEYRPKRAASRGPMLAAIAVATFGLLAMLLVDHGPWSAPTVQTAEVANHKTTGAAARAAGATITSTAPKPEIEPVAPGPKPAQPANPQ
jgi:hypothetical protein